MPVNVTSDQEKAFDEAYALAGVLIDIDGTPNIEAIKPDDATGTQGFNNDGTNDDVSETSITVKTADIPPIAIDSVVTLDSIEWRITGNDAEGKACRTLELETP
jgi:hypothetical protein